jgi:hypothetical protein
VLPVHPRAAGARRECLLLYFFITSFLFFSDKTIEFLCDKTARIIFRRYDNEYFVETYVIEEGQRHSMNCREVWQPANVFIPPNLRSQLLSLRLETKKWIVADEFVFFFVDIYECSVIISTVLLVV